MKTLHFTINARTVESYLYGGYLFLLMADGRILYLPYRQLIYILCEKYPQYDRLIRLAFLHNEYFKSQAAQMLLGIGELKDAIARLWNRATRELQFEIDFRHIEEKVHSMGTWVDLPLDVYMYDLRMFVANSKGVMESRLNPDFGSPNYPLAPTAFEKCFDQKVVALNARAGKVVLSADREGLFYGNALVENIRVNIDDKNNIPGRSLRTGWSDFDLINYESASNFKYLTNETAVMENISTNRFRFGEKRELKEIVNFATSSLEMEDMMGKSGIDKESVKYSFNTQGRGFFVLNDGSFVNATIKKVENEPIQYSSHTSKLPSLTTSGEKARPLKAAAVPNGCVLEFFDKVVLYQKGAVHVLEEVPTYNIRTYMGSRHYRDMVTITKEESVSFHSVDILDTIISRRIFA